MAKIHCSVQEKTYGNPDLVEKAQEKINTPNKKEIMLQIKTKPSIKNIAPITPYKNVEPQIKKNQSTRLNDKSTSTVRKSHRTLAVTRHP